MRNSGELCVQAAPTDGVGYIHVGIHDGTVIAPPDIPARSRSLEQPETTHSQALIVPPTHLSIQPELHSKGTERKVNARDVFWLTLVMAAACGVGALPFFFISNVSIAWAGMANAVACGVMLAASFDLLHEAEGYASAPLVLGLVVGCLFIKFMQDWLHQYEDVKFEGFSGANAKKILLFIGIMAAHAVGEGSGVGARPRMHCSFCFAGGAPCQADAAHFTACDEAVTRTHRHRRVCYARQNSGAYTSRAYCRRVVLRPPRLVARLAGHAGHRPAQHTGGPRRGHGARCARQHAPQGA